MEPSSESLTSEIEAIGRTIRDQAASIQTFENDLNMRIRERFAAEFAILEQMRQRETELRDRAKSLTAERRTAWERETLQRFTRLVPGTTISWKRSEGWGQSRTIVKFLEISDKGSVKIDTGERLHPMKWVQMKSIEFTANTHFRDNQSTGDANA